MGDKNGTPLKAFELKAGEKIYFSEGAKGQKRKRFKPGIVKEIYTNHILVEVLTEEIKKRAINRYNVSLDKSGINCGDIIVQRSVKPSEIVSQEDIVVE